MKMWPLNFFRMPNNLRVGNNGCTAKTTISFVDAGVTALNTAIIYEVDNPNRSYVPGRGINAITGFTLDMGYYIVMLQAVDWSEFLTPPTGGVVVGEYDAQAQAYITAVGMSSTPHKAAVDAFVTGLKSAGIWLKAKGIYPHYGTTFNEGKINLVNPALKILTQVGTGTFSGGFHQSGEAGAGLFTGITPLEFSAGLHWGYYLYVASTAPTHVEVGVTDGTNLTYDQNGPGGYITAFGGGSTNHVETIMVAATNLGFWSFNVSAFGGSGILKVMHNGSGAIQSGANPSTASIPDGAKSSSPFVIGNGFITGGQSDGSHFGVSVFTDNLSDSELGQLNTLVQTFETAIRA